MKLASVLPALLLALHGCHGGVASTEVPARLVEPSEASRAELAAVVSRALGTSTVSLPADALTTDSRLILEHQARRDLEHGRIIGRDMGKPEQFKLIIRGQQCILVHTATGERWPLTQARCVAAGSGP